MQIDEVNQEYMYDAVSIRPSRYGRVRVSGLTSTGSGQLFSVDLRFRANGDFDNAWTCRTSYAQGPSIWHKSTSSSAYSTATASAWAARSSGLTT